MYSIKEYLTDNSRFLKAYNEKKDIEYLRKFINKSGDVDFDIEEFVSWGRLYEYTVDGVRMHSHSMKRLLSNLINVIEDNPFAVISLDEDGFHRDELRMVRSFLQIVRNDQIGK